MSDLCMYFLQTANVFCFLANPRYPSIFFFAIYSNRKLWSVISLFSLSLQPFISCPCCHSSQQCCHFCLLLPCKFCLTVTLTPNKGCHSHCGQVGALYYRLGTISYLLHPSLNIAISGSGTHPPRLSMSCCYSTADPAMQRFCNGHRVLWYIG